MSKTNSTISESLTNRLSEIKCKECGEPVVYFFYEEKAHKMFINKYPGLDITETPTEDGRKVCIIDYCRAHMERV